MLRSICKGMISNVTFWVLGVFFLLFFGAISILNLYQLISLEKLESDVDLARFQDFVSFILKFLYYFTLRCSGSHIISLDCWSIDKNLLFCFFLICFILFFVLVFVCFFCLFVCLCNFLCLCPANEIWNIFQCKSRQKCNWEEDFYSLVI